MSIEGDAPHLGLAVAPADDDVVAKVGAAVEPLWKVLLPDNAVFDVLRMGDPSLDAVIRQEGRLLYRG